MMVVALYVMSFSAPLVTMGQTISNTKTVATQKETKATFKVKNTQIPLNSNWTSKDNFESATNIDGKKLDWKDIEKKVVVTGAVDTKKSGVYKVTYTLNKISQTVSVEVSDKINKTDTKKEKKNLEISEIKVKNVSVPLNGTFDVSSTFDSAITKDAQTLSWQDVSSIVKVDNTVDTSKIGTYKVTFMYGNLTAISEVSVVAIPVKVNVKPITIEVGELWNNQDAFVSVDMSDGQVLNWEAVKEELLVNQNVDVNNPGVYQITYTYRGISSDTNITVAPKKVVPVEIKVIDNTLNVGDTWLVSENFDSVVMSDGTKLLWQDISRDIAVNGQVDTSKVGTYSVTYSYGGKSATAVITVKAIEVIQIQEVSVKDSTLSLGQNWIPSDNFNYVMMSSGSKLIWSDVEKDIVIKGTVDTKKAGTYKVTYEYGNRSAVATVVVKDMRVIKVQEISLKNTTLPIGTKWNPVDNFNYVMMSDGTKLSWKDVEKDIKIHGEVNFNKIGVYKITYEYGDRTAVATVVVKDVEVTKVQDISVKDSTLTLGDTWQASDNFNYVTMSDGVKLSFKDVQKGIKVKGNVDTKQVGTYKVQYDYYGKSAIATIVVKEKKIENVHSVFVKNSKIELGSKWQASDNFLGVRLANGTELFWKDVSKDIIVKGTVDTNKIGTYKVSYTYGEKTETAVITVVKNTVPVTTNKTLPQTGEKDGFITFIVGLSFLFTTFIIFTLKIWKQEG